MPRLHIIADVINHQGRNQERANRTIAPTKFLQTWCHSRTSHEKLYLETALPLRELLLKITLSHTCCVKLVKTTNQSMYHDSENSQHRTGDKLWGASCEVKPVPSPWGAFVGLSPQTKHQALPNWNMKRYKSMQLLSTLKVKPPLHKRKAPPPPPLRTNAKPRAVVSYSLQQRKRRAINQTLLSQNPTVVKLQRRLIVKHGFWNTTETAKRFYQTQQQQTIRPHCRLTQRGKTINPWKRDCELSQFSN